MTKLKDTLAEYREWIADDCMSIFRLVKPTLGNNVRELNLQIGNKKMTLFENINRHKMITEVPKRVKDLGYPIGEYPPLSMLGDFEVHRMDTLRPNRKASSAVTWPLYDRFAEDGTLPNPQDALTLSLMEMGLHESLEWITYTEIGAPEKNYDQGFEEDPYHDVYLKKIKKMGLPWPHDTNQDLCANAKVNGRWYRLSICF